MELKSSEMYLTQAPKIISVLKKRIIGIDEHQKGDFVKHIPNLLDDRPTYLTFQ